MENERLRGDILAAPCIFCGYDGVQYWQKHSHAKDCLFYEFGGIEDREDVLLRISLTEWKPKMHILDINQVAHQWQEGGEECRKNWEAQDGE
uniref:Uncharacterized protein n=1 Tax=viral metagenome TaxID=1070528 RepID=A0A6M3KC34_9ZZZZ